MKKKLLSLILGTAMIAGSLTGCGLAGQNSQNTDNSSQNAEQTQGTQQQESAAESDGKVELEFFNCKVEGEAVFNKVIEKFQEENPNIVVKQTAPADAETVLFTRISTGDVPDVMSV